MLKRVIRIKPISPTTINHILVMLKIVYIYIYIYVYKKQDNITLNNTSNIYNYTNQYSTDVFNNYKINKTHNVKKTYYNSNNDVCY